MSLTLEDLLSDGNGNVITLVGTRSVSLDESSRTIHNFFGISLNQIKKTLTKIIKNIYIDFTSTPLGDPEISVKSLLNEYYIQQPKKFLSIFKDLLFNEGIKYDFQTYIHKLNKNNFLPQNFKKEATCILIEAEQDFNLKCASLFAQSYDISPIPLTELIDLYNQDYVFARDEENIESTKETIRKIINFYSDSNHDLSIKLNNYFFVDIKFEEEEIISLKNEVIEVNAKIISEKCDEILARGYYSQIEILIKQPLPLSLNPLIQAKYEEYYKGLYDTFAFEKPFNIEAVIKFISSNGVKDFLKSNSKVEVKSFLKASLPEGVYKLLYYNNNFKIVHAKWIKEISKDVEEESIAAAEDFYAQIDDDVNTEINNDEVEINGDGPYF